MAFGEKLNLRNTVVQKLGPTQQSLAREGRPGHVVSCLFFIVLTAVPRLYRHTQLFVPIKILSAHSTLMQSQDADKLVCYGACETQRQSQPTSGRTHIITFIELEGPRGHHTGLVQSDRHYLGMEGFPFWSSILGTF